MIKKILLSVTGFIFFLPLFFLLTSCDGGGSSKNDDEDTLTILEEYNFQIGGTLQGGGASAINLVQTDGVSLSATPNVRGSVNCDTVTQICDIQSVSVGSSISIIDQSTNLPVSGVDINVDTPWVYNPPGSDNPASGGLTISPQGTDSIFVDVTDCDELPGTEIQVNETDCYPWNEFEDLMENPGSSDVEIIASLGWNAIELMLEQAGYSMQVFPYIDEDYLTNPGTNYYEQCDAFAASWPDGPPVNPGGFFITWYDDLANGVPGPADSFRLEYNHCWLDDEGDNIDTYFRGVIDFVGYTEVVDNDIITRIGFETAAEGSGKIGGAAYGWGDDFENQPLVISETVESDGVISIDNELTLTGRYLIVFSAAP